MERTMSVKKIDVHRQRIASGMAPNLEKKRVCAYCRVSTDEEGQDSSYDLQVEYYTRLIKSDQRWSYAGVYADHGKSGTSTKKRLDFNLMIEECRKGNIDLIITKSISRFARNTLDCLEHIRELKSMSPPVGVYFEKEKIHTLDAKNELLLTILSSLAQEEARSTSENLKWSIQKRFQAGKARIPTNFLLGYEKDEDGNLIINEEEAKIVRRVYKSYMEGKGARTIAGELKSEGVISGRGTTNWGKSSIMHLLKNERYCGDVLMQKSYTVDFITHQQKENKGQMPRYFIENHHDAIIPKDEWEAVQEEIKRRHEIATTKDRKIRQGYSNVSVMSNKFFCGHCGQPVTRHTATLKSGGKEEKIGVWRCRATSAKSRKKSGCDPCYAKRQQEPKLQEGFMEMLKTLKSTQNEEMHSDEELMMILDDLGEEQPYKEDYFRDLIETGVIYDEGKVDYTFKSGLTATSYIKHDSRNRTRKKNTKKIKEKEE